MRPIRLLLLLAAVLLPAAAASAQPERDLRDLVFTPVVPCRILDTRAGSPNPGAGQGPLAPGAAFGFAVRDRQGGPSCGVPATAAVAVLNFVAAAASGNGNLRVWPYAPGTPVPPTASALNYTGGFNTANEVAIALCNPGAATCAQDLLAQTSFSAAHLVVDVLGYYSAPWRDRPWGEGRASVRGYGPGGAESTCRNGNLVFTLSSLAVHWEAAPSACPTGSWVCDTNEIVACDTARPDGNCDIRNCAGGCTDLAPGLHLGWTAASNGADGGLARNEAFGRAGFETCRSLPVWCCSLAVDLQ
jgi:hypothetical protein